jgi:hypothetical protein
MHVRRCRRSCSLCPGRTSLPSEPRDGRVAPLWRQDAYHRSRAPLPANTGKARGLSMSLPTPGVCRTRTFPALLPAKSRRASGPSAGGLALVDRLGPPSPSSRGGADARLPRLPHRATAAGHGSSAVSLCRMSPSGRRRRRMRARPAVDRQVERARVDRGHQVLARSAAIPPELPLPPPFEPPVPSDAPAPPTVISSVAPAVTANAPWAYPPAAAGVRDARQHGGRQGDSPREASPALAIGDRHASRSPARFRLCLNRGGRFC